MPSLLVPLSSVLSILSCEIRRAVDLERGRQIILRFQFSLARSDGLHRLQEAQAQGQREIKAYVFKGSLAQVHLLNLQLNHMRGKTPPTQMARVVRLQSIPQ